MVLELGEFGPQDNSEWVRCVRLWEMVACLKLQLAGGRNREVKAVTSGTQGGVWCWTDLTGDAVVWRDETAVQKRKKKKDRDNTPDNRRVLESDPACDSAVMWSGTGQGATPGLAVVDVTWYDARKREGVWTKAPFYPHSSSLSLFLTHARSQTSAVCLIHRSLPCSVNLICPALLPPTFLRSLILSCPFPLLSFSFSLLLVSCFPPSGLQVCHAVQSSGHGCGSRPASNG